MGDSIDNIERESEGDQDSVLNTLIKGNIISEIHISLTIVFYLIFMFVGIKALGQRSSGFLRIFTVAFLLFLAPAGGSYPAGPIFLTLRGTL